MNPARIQWRMPEYEYRAKGTSWYWISIALAVLVLAFAVWQRNFLFAVFVVIAELLILTWAHRAPKLIEFTLTDAWLDVGGEKRYPLREFAAWSIDEGVGEVSELVFVFTQKFKPALRVNFPKELHDHIEQVLAPLLPQKESERSLFDALEKFLRF